MSIYLRQKWVDPRLMFDEARLEHNEGRRGTNAKRIMLPVGSHNDIWTPDTFFRNAKEREVSNRLILLKPNGEVWYVEQ